MKSIFLALAAILGIAIGSAGLTPATAQSSFLNSANSGGGGG